MVYLSGDRTPNEDVVVKPRAHDDSLRRAVLDGHHPSTVALQHSLALPQI